MKQKKDHRLGKQIVYPKDVKHKGTQLMASRVVAIKGRKVVLENGDTIVLQS